MFVLELLHSDLAKPPVWRLKGQRGWNLTGAPEILPKPVLEKPSTTFRELENSGLLCLWAQRSSLQALSPKQRCYRDFIERLQWATLAANRLV